MNYILKKNEIETNIYFEKIRPMYILDIIFDRSQVLLYYSSYLTKNYSFNERYYLKYWLTQIVKIKMNIFRN